MTESKGEFSPSAGIGKKVDETQTVSDSQATSVAP